MPLSNFEGRETLSADRIKVRNHVLHPVEARARFLVLGTLLVALSFIMPAAGAPSRREPRDIGAPHTTSTVPVDWHPILSGTNAPGGMGAGFMAYDPQRDRILFTVVPFDSEGIGLEPRLLVLDSSGQVVSNASLSLPPGSAPSVSVDPTSGSGYVASGSTILRVDSATGAILDTWAYPFWAGITTARGASLYASAVDANGFLPIQVIDTATGTVQGNLSKVPATPYEGFLLDPSGRWLLAAQYQATALLIDLTTGDFVDLGLTEPTFALAADGVRAYVCGRTATAGRHLWSLWLSNQTLLGHPDAPCSGSLASNPVTGVVASGSGLLLTPVGASGRTALGWPNSDGQGLAWSSDGRLLVALELTASGFELGSWDGTPHLLHLPVEPELLNPQYNYACAELVSAAGMNLTDAAVYLDGGSTPVYVGLADPFACVEITDVPDGAHRLHVMGWDLLGQRLDDSVAFDSDGTPPALAIASPAETQTVPYTLRGWENDSHPGAVSVGEVISNLAGTEWSVIVPLRIGNNSFTVSASDLAGNQAAPLDAVVRYWPARTNNVTNATEHFQVSVPPGWTTSSQALPGGGWYAFNLIGPIESPIPPLVSITAIQERNVSQGQSYATIAAQTSASYIASIGGTIVTPVHAETVAGHPAAAFEARVSIAGIAVRYIQTVIVSPEWGRLYVVTAAIPEATWPTHPEDLDWILEGFRIESSATPPSGPLAGVLIWAIGGVAAGAAAAAIGVALWVRRRGKAGGKGPPGSEGTSSGSPPMNAPPEPPPKL